MNYKPIEHHFLRLMKEAVNTELEDPQYIRGYKTYLLAQFPVHRLIKDLSCSTEVEKARALADVDRWVADVLRDMTPEVRTGLQAEEFSDILHNLPPPFVSFPCSPCFENLS